MSVSDNNSILTNLATTFRNALDHVTSCFITGAFSKFPKECGADACELLHYYLLNVHHIQSDYRVGKVQMSSRSTEISHCFLVVNGIIIDITADQFHKEWFPKVIVCENEKYPLIPYFKYVKNKSIDASIVLNPYLLQIYKKVIKQIKNS